MWASSSSQVCSNVVSVPGQNKLNWAVWLWFCHRKSALERYLDLGSSTNHQPMCANAPETTHQGVNALRAHKSAGRMLQNKDRAMKFFFIFSLKCLFHWGRMPNHTCGYQTCYNCLGKNLLNIIPNHKRDMAKRLCVPQMPSCNLPSLQ